MKHNGTQEDKNYGLSPFRIPPSTVLALDDEVAQLALDKYVMVNRLLSTNKHHPQMLNLG